MKHHLLSLACLALLESLAFAAPSPDNAEAEKTIDSVSAIILGAKKPQDLDGLIKKLTDLSHPLGQAGFDAGAQKEMMRLQAADRFVKGWQDYLAASVAGDNDRVKNSLENILRSQQLGDPIFLPRSQILAREYGPVISDSATQSYESSDQILDEVKTVDDLESALTKIDKIPPNQPDSTKHLNWSQLEKFIVEYNKIKVGMPVDIDLDAFMEEPVIGVSISRVKTLILLYVVPRYLGLAEADPPKPGELLRDYLVRVGDSAAAKEDWSLLQNILNVRLRLSGHRSSTNGDGSVQSYAGTQCFLAGLSQEAGGQFEFAVKSYQDALKSTDLLLPQKVIAGRLAVIKANHPDEYEKGMEDSLIPPFSVVQQQTGLGGNQRIMWNPMNQPNLPGYLPANGIVSVTPIPANISIPASSAVQNDSAANPTKSAAETK